MNTLRQICGSATQFEDINEISSQHTIPMLDCAQQLQTHSSREPEEHNKSANGKGKYNAQAAALTSMGPAPAVGGHTGGRPSLATLPNVAVASSENFLTKDLRILGLINHRRGRIISVSNEVDKDKEVYGVRQFISSAASHEHVKTVSNDVGVEATS